MDKVTIYIPMKSINEQEQNFLDILRAVPESELRKKQQAIQDLAPRLQYAVVHTYIHTYRGIYMHDVDIYIHTHTYIHTYMLVIKIHSYRTPYINQLVKYIHTYIVHTTNEYSYRHTYINAYIHIYIHTYIHTYMHAYIHTYTSIEC